MQNTYISFLVEKLFDGDRKHHVSSRLASRQADTHIRQPYTYQTWIKAGIEAGPDNVSYVAIQSLAKGFFARIATLCGLHTQLLNGI